MRMLRSFGLSLLIVMLVCGCSIDLNQTSPATPAPTQGSNAPTGASQDSSTPQVAATKVPVTWTDLDLTGSLFYINSNSNSDNFSPSIQRLDLKTGEIFTVFHAAKGAWIFYLDVSPDGQQLLISYIDPNQPGAASSRALYTLPADGTAAPKLLFPPPTTDDHYTQAEWSPDGNYIYYAHYNDKKPQINNLTPDYDIYRVSYPGGQSEQIAEHAFWPRLSADAARLVYVSIDSGTGNNGLVVANADGSDPTPIAFPDSWTSDIVDAPIFTPDNQTVLFSVPTPAQSYQPNWLDKVMGVQVVKAHSVPSDWWSVPVAGGSPKRLTHLETVNLFASLLPDKQHVVSLSGDGLFVMDLDGSNLMRLVSDPELYGSVRWTP